MWAALLRGRAKAQRRQEVWGVSNARRDAELGWVSRADADGLGVPDVGGLARGPRRRLAGRRGLVERRGGVGGVGQKSRRGAEPRRAWWCLGASVREGPQLGKALGAFAAWRELKRRLACRRGLGQSALRLCGSARGPRRRRAGRRGLVERRGGVGGVGQESRRGAEARRAWWCLGASGREGPQLGEALGAFAAWRELKRRLACRRGLGQSALRLCGSARGPRRRRAGRRGLVERRGGVGGVVERSRKGAEAPRGLGCLVS